MHAKLPLKDQPVGSFTFEEMPKGTQTASPPNRTGHYDAASPFVGKVIKKVELHTKASERNCIHVEVDLTGQKKQIKYFGSYTLIYIIIYT